MAQYDTRYIRTIYYRNSFHEALTSHAAFADVASDGEPEPARKGNALADGEWYEKWVPQTENVMKNR